MRETDFVLDGTLRSDGASIREVESESFQTDAGACAPTHNGYDADSASTSASIIRGGRRVGRTGCDSR